MYPRFILNSIPAQDPKTFFSPPVIIQFTPGYINFTYEPFEGVRVNSDYWAPASNAIYGHLSIIGLHSGQVDLEVEWNAALTFLDEGEAIAVVSKGRTHILHGRSGNLNLVCFMSGGPSPNSSSLTGLTQKITLQNKQEQHIHWTLVAGDTLDHAFDMAKKLAGRNWDAVIAKNELIHISHLLEIFTGDPEWDMCFNFAQHKARELFFPGNQSLPFPSFVLSRRPDQGYSMRGDGSDFNAQWNGQTALDTYYISQLLLPGEVPFVEGLLKNFLATQDLWGEIDCKPGLGGQRTRRLLMPILATLCYELAPYQPDHAWLKDIYPRLLNFIQAWFSKQNDEDEDGFPEWHHSIQTSLEDAPMYDRWGHHTQGIDVSTLETPQMGSLLYRELTSLLKISAILEEKQSVEILNAWRDRIHRHVNTLWNHKLGVFSYRDYQTHLVKDAIHLAAINHSGSVRLRKKFSPAQRLLFTFIAATEETHTFQITLFAKQDGKEVTEVFSSSAFTWSFGVGRLTTKKTYEYIERVKVEGVEKPNVLEITTPDYTLEDISCLMPLWAGLPDIWQAQQMVQKAILPRYARPFGLATAPGSPSSLANDNVSLLWNQLILEGLIQYNNHEQAVAFFSHLMKGIQNSLRSTGSIREIYHASTGQPSGELNSLRGLAPVGLFMKILGVQVINSHDVIVWGKNPFLWPVTVKYQGMSIFRQAEQTTISFPGGQSVNITSPEIQRITLPRS